MKIKNQKIIKQLNILEEQRLVLVKKQGYLIPAFIFIPALVLVISFLKLGTDPPFFIFSTLMGAMVSFLWNSLVINEPFKKIKEKVRSALISEFMETFHPDTTFDYSFREQQGKSIIKSSNLISADHYSEEDVIRGQYKNGNFYISEMHLEDSDDDFSTTVFKGMLISLNIPGKSFPKSRIQSEVGLVQKWFSGFEQETNYGFWFDTDNPQSFYNTLEPLFPFIKHLASKRGKLRISTNGSIITILMESKMNFLDSPSQRLRDSFLNQDYFTNMAKQLNSLLFIMDAFLNNLNTEEIEERLDLYELQVAEKIRNV